MISLIRLLMIALLALAIPLQGTAAATMLYCGPDHGLGTDRARTQGHHTEDSAQAYAGRGHDTPERAQSHSEAPAAALLTSSDAPDQSTQARCSVCAACCDPATIAASALPHSPIGVKPAPSLQSSSLPYSFITDAPRRPPRPFLA